MHSSSTCTLPPLSDLFLNNSNNSIMSNITAATAASSINATTRSSSVLDISNLLSSPPTTQDYYNNNTSDYRRHHHHQHHNHSRHHSSISHDQHQRNLKAKRKRASPNQLVVLNRIFAQTYFPSTEVRIELGKQLGMSPRTVQIWFQNKRQALRSRGRHVPEEPTNFYLPPISPPRSPPTDLRFHHFQQEQQSFCLPPLRLVSSPQQQSPPTMSYPSPNSIDHLHYRDY